MKKDILSWKPVLKHRFDEEVKAMAKVGGYWYWDWKFPFRHFKKEELYIATQTGMYSIK